MVKSLRSAYYVVFALACMLSPFPAFTEPIIHPMASGIKQLQSNHITVDISNQSFGYVMTLEDCCPAHHIAVTTRDDKEYQFSLPGNSEYVVLPLSEGSGEYLIDVYEQVTPKENNYRRVFRERTTVSMPDPRSVFLIPNQYVWYTEQSALISKAEELCANVTDDYDKFEILYDYVSQHILYDYVKATTIVPPYLPDPDETLASGRGICFDSAALLAAMLRDQGIPTQLVIGKLHIYSPPMAHAWNCVLLDENWVLVDPTLNTVALWDPDYAAERYY